MLLKEVIEALVFASQKPLTPKEIVAALRSAVDDSDEEPVRAMAELKESEVGAFLEQLQFEYRNEHRAFQLVEGVDGWSIVTKPDFALWVRQLYPESKPTRLSGPALETLAIIAYRQPVTRADIEVVRGVAVDGVMQNLLERGLVRIAGRADVPGRPLLYETTQVFMQHFGLRTLDELPNVDELRKVRLPSTTPPTTGELFTPDALHPDDEQPQPDAPQPVAPDASSELPPAGEPALTEADAESVAPSTDHVADPHP
ncbi:MAG: SMC-Scp complex subunit ScpB [Verrucomicrobia bacterium]|nr:SMC-Scp complex subunit ScpB [Verrucomicrobiota bacterium]